MKARTPKLSAVQLGRLRLSDYDAFVEELVQRGKRGRRPRAPEVHLVLNLLHDATAWKKETESDADAMRAAIGRLQPVQLWAVLLDRCDEPKGADITAILTTLTARVAELAAAMPAFRERRLNPGRAGKPEALDALVADLATLLRGGRVRVSAETVRKLREGLPVP